MFRPIPYLGSLADADARGKRSLLAYVLGVTRMTLARVAQLLLAWADQGVNRVGFVRFWHEPDQPGLTDHVRCSG